MQNIATNRHRGGLAAVIALGLLSSAPLAASTPPTLEQRLERATDRLEQARIEQHIPGMAIAIVQDDEVILARGFGLADLEDETPVTEETIFAIGSSTKAFTATVIGMLVDEGRMTWDDPVTRWLPYFTLAVDSDDEGEVILLRDMLCHRTGFSRMSILFANGKVPREEILRTANAAEPYAPFRAQFHYNNVMFMAAGMCAGVAADSTWEELIATRILEPLGMDDSSLSVEAAQADSRLALGYRWDNDNEVWERDHMRDIDEIGPAGAINSNVLDMAQWLRFQLGRGEFESKRLLSEEAHAETWKPQMQIAPGASYGFGWMVREWRGQPLIEHGGNIDGFAAQVAMLPDSDLGFVLLTNTGFSRLQGGSIGIVFEALAGDWEIDDGQGDDVASGEDVDDFGDYTGVYVANYAQFKDEKFTVSVEEDGRLAIDIPSQTRFKLDPPGNDGRRPFAELPGVAASFVRNDEGEVEIMRLYQNRLQFDVPREGYEYPIEIPIADLEKYRGAYRFEAMNQDVNVLVKNNHLAVDVPGQMVFELHPPDDENRWQFRNNDVLKIFVTFEEGEFGEIESMTLNQMGQAFTMPKIRGASEEDLPTLDDVFEIAGLDDRQAALERAAVIRVTGQARFAQAGVTGTTTLVLDAGARTRQDLDMGQFGMIRTALDGERAFADVSFDEFDELEGRQLDTAKRDHPASFLGDWRAFYDEIRVTGTREIDGRPAITLDMKKGDLPAVTMSLDAETGDPMRIETMIEVPGLDGITFPITTDFRDWREIDGLRMPFEFTVETNQNGHMIMTFDDVEMRVDVPDDFFTLARDEGVAIAR